MDEWKSARCESLSAVRGEFDNETEYDIAISKLDWTDMSQSDASSSSSAGSTDMNQSDASLTSAGNIVDHRHYFEVLQSDAKWGKWCSRFKNVVLGEKLAEGAQGAIFNAQVSQAGKTVRGKYVVKMMKDDCALEDFQKQWPDGLAKLSRSLYIMNVHGALVIDPVTQKGRFGFVMKKHMGDLRKLIDSRMEQKKGFGPPFPDRQVMRLVSWIVDDMQMLHDAVSFIRI